ncbi:MAG: putative lipid II flippase FtsW [Mycobacteriales bacterium]|nr:MAG: putative lipid II flippase FtsW [Pseudonocardiales bacterium]
MTRTDAAADERTTNQQPFFDRPLASLHMLLVASGLLCVIGVVMVLSASSVDAYRTTGSAFGIFTKQLLWLAIGIPTFWIAVRISPRAYRRLAYPALLLAFVGLMAVLVPGVGILWHGARRWIDLGPLQVQPSEPAKLALALWGADLLVRKQNRLSQWRHLVVPLLPVALAMCALVMFEPDLGTTLCIALVIFGLLWTAGAPFRLFGSLAVGAMGIVVLLIVHEPYRLRRVVSFVHPFQDRSGNGFQAAQGLSALSTGGWFGDGLGQSRFKWGLLPNAHTDYIFAIIGEELGLVGCLVVLGLFLVLAYAGLRIARNATEPFVCLVTGAVTAWILGQALINVGYVVGLLPVTGIPLPLISFGGTSLVLTLFTLGMLASFARHEPAAAAALANRGKVARALRLPAPRAGRAGPERVVGRAARRARATAARAASTKATEHRERRSGNVGRRPRVPDEALRSTGTEGIAGR